jgi:hypothetical protein
VNRNTKHRTARCSFELFNKKTHMTFSIFGYRVKFYKPAVASVKIAPVAIKRKYTIKHKARKRNYKRECDLCRKSCKGLAGLGVHKRKFHGIASDGSSVGGDKGAFGS